MQLHPFGLTRENKIFLALLALIGAVMIVVSTNRHGVVVWPDSIIYISTARKVLAGAGFVIFDGEPLALWPPLYPALLAMVARVFGTDPLIVAPFINAIIFGIIVYLSGAMMFRYLSSAPILAFLGSLAVLFSIPLVSISVVAYSEPLFIMFMVLSFIFMGTYLTNHERLPLLLLSLSVSLACLARYLGITLIVWGGMIVLFFNRNSLKKRIADLFIFAAVTVIPLGGWLTRNFILTNTLSGPRIPPAFSLAQILIFGSNNILEWYLPGVIASRTILLTLVIAAIAFMVVYSLRARWQWLKVNLRQLYPPLMFVVSCLLFIVIYSGFLVITALNSYVSLFETRMWAPIFIPLTLLFLVFIREFVSQVRKRFSGKKIKLVLFAGIAIWLIYPASATAVNIAYLIKVGDGIGGPAWMESETIHYLLENPLDCAIYSNGPDVIYFLTKLDPKWTPKRGGTDADLSSQAGTWPPERKACIVWFDNINRTTLYTPNELITITNLEQTLTFKDGAIYIVTKK